MNIPNEIQIGGHVVTTTLDYLFRERADVFGQFSCAQGVIRITGVDGSGVPIARSLVEQVWWHEVVHAIDRVFNGSKLDDDTTERLSQGIYQVVQQLMAGHERKA